MAMRDDLLIEHMKAALRAAENQSDEEWFAEMEAAGIIDADGNVLRRMPEPPEEAKANGRRPRRRKSLPSRKATRRSSGRGG
jgi:hypothetical protein